MAAYSAAHMLAKMDTDLEDYFTNEFCQRFEEFLDDYNAKKQTNATSQNQHDAGSEPAKTD